MSKTTDLIIIEQLPIIKQQLELMSNEIKQETEAALALEVTEDTVKEVKEVRTVLRKKFDELEERRKDVKAQIFEPYNQFEVVYKEYISDIYKSADSQLKTKIDDVQNGVKDAKRAKVQTYFNEYCAAKGIDFVTLNQTGINITLSASEKSLKEQVKAFIDEVADSLKLIDTDEAAAEILVEYKQSLNFTLSVMNVRERRSRLEAEKLRIQQTEEAKAAATEAIKKVDEAVQLTAPTVEPEPEPTYRVPFAVTGTKAEINRLVQYMKSQNIKYESIKEA